MGSLGIPQYFFPPALMSFMGFSCFILWLLFLAASTIASPPYSHFGWFTAIGKKEDTHFLLFLQVALESIWQCCSDFLFPVILTGFSVDQAPVWLQHFHYAGLLYIQPHNLSFAKRYTLPGKEKQFQEKHGTFFRIDIPYILDEVRAKINEKNHSITVHHETIFYTDSDVLFLNFARSDIVLPAMLAAGPQTRKDSISNVGVLFMNVTAFKPHIPALVTYGETVTKWIGNDQQMILGYFRGNITKLSDDYNWKGFWGLNHQAKIFHMQGTKYGRCLECYMRFINEGPKVNWTDGCKHAGSVCSHLGRTHRFSALRYKVSFQDQMFGYSYFMKQFYDYLYDFSVRLRTPTTFS